MKRFILFIKSKRLQYLILLISSIFFFSTFALYELPIGAVIYPALLSFSVMIVANAAEYLRSNEKHKNLSRQKCLPDDILANISKYTSSDDLDYREIIEIALKKISDMEEEATRLRADTEDYYTAWVHQIKTPIASARLTLESADSAEARRISEEITRIEQYAEMALTYQRLNSESTDYVFRKYDIDSLMRKAIKRFASQFIERGIKLEYSPIDISAVTDEKWRIFVLEQIISNSLKYTKEGSISIYSEGDILVIRDSGIGISKEDLPRIFEKGYTGEAGRLDRRASGLGLYLSSRIIENLGHTIKAFSEVGVGTRIEIDFSQNNNRHE